MQIAKKSEYGKIEISKNVVARIVREEISNYEDRVFLVAKSGMRESFFKQIRLQDGKADIDAEVREGGLSVRVYIVLRFGLSISRTCASLIEGISDKIEKYLGEKPEDVILVVKGLAVKDHVLARNFEVRRGGIFGID